MRKHLSSDTRERIVAYFRANPNASTREAGREFGVSAETARCIRRARGLPNAQRGRARPYDFLERQVLIAKARQLAEESGGMASVEQIAATLKVNRCTLSAWLVQDTKRRQEMAEAAARDVDLSVGVSWSPPELAAERRPLPPHLMVATKSSGWE